MCEGRLCACVFALVFFFSSRRRHTRLVSDWSSDVCSSDLGRLSARSASTSTTFPLPSSPHWAPTTTTQWVFGPNMAPQQKRPKSGALEYPPTEARPVLLARQRALRGRARQRARPSRTHTGPRPALGPEPQLRPTPEP